MPELRLRSDAVEWREIEEEIVAVDTRKAIYMAVNRTGAVLWPALAEGTSREELVGLLTQAFEVERSIAEADVDAFLRLLDENDLLDR